jgi:hypothetical protein
MNSLNMEMVPPQALPGVLYCTHYCHQCKGRVTVNLETSECERCNGGFVEEISGMFPCTRFVSTNLFRGWMTFASA